MFQLRGEGADFQWWFVGDPGYRHLLNVGGFEIVEESKRFLLTYGEGGSSPLKGHAAAREQVRNWLFTRDRRLGHPHRAFLCRPRS